MEIKSYAATPTSIAGSDMLCTLPRWLMNHFSASLDLLSLPIPLAPVQIRAFWHPRRREDPARRWLREMLFAAAGVGFFPRHKSGLDGEGVAL